jgi:type I restriction enzyme S subunit
MKVSNSDVLTGTIYAPSKLEQQKIAQCLSSLDEVIAAGGERLAALGDYKKGLMQQLFPRPERIENGKKVPAETIPRLRFPEFRDAGEWEWTTVDAIAEIFKGKGISKADIVADGERPCVRYGELYTTYGEVIDEVASRTNVPKRDLFMSRANDVIIPSSGETKIDIATAACVLHHDIALGGDLNVIRSAHDGRFLSYFLNGPLKYSIAKVAQGDSVVHLYPSQIGTLNIAIPSADEQKRIADTMFAVDRALVERRHQIVALKAHKSGLMQQLFPSPVERGA